MQARKCKTSWEESPQVEKVQRARLAPPSRATGRKHLKKVNNILTETFDHYGEALTAQAEFYRILNRTAFQG